MDPYTGIEAPPWPHCGLLHPRHPRPANLEGFLIVPLTEYLRFPLVTGDRPRTRKLLRAGSWAKSMTKDRLADFGVDSALTPRLSTRVFSSESIEHLVHGPPPFRMLLLNTTFEVRLASPEPWSRWSESPSSIRRVSPLRFLEDKDLRMRGYDDHSGDPFQALQQELVSGRHLCCLRELDCVSSISIPFSVFRLTMTGRNPSIDRQDLSDALQGLAERRRRFARQISCLTSSLRFEFILHQVAVDASVKYKSLQELTVP